MALLFEALCSHTGKTPRWGMLTGIHPIKLLRQLAARFGETEAERLFREKYFVSAEKTALAVRTLREAPYGGRRGERLRAVHLGAVLPDALRVLLVRFAERGKNEKSRSRSTTRCSSRKSGPRRTASARLGFVCARCHVGGGTPTTFSAERLRAMIETVRAAFDLSACTEFTVEAGRPDTIDREKLEALFQGGVTRISINPQTLQDSVLENIGRRHTAQQTVEAFRLARAVGFTNINMDLIVGLPGDTYESFCYTIEKVLALDPEKRDRARAGASVPRASRRAARSTGRTLTRRSPTA